MAISRSFSVTSTGGAHAAPGVVRFTVSSNSRFISLRRPNTGSGEREVSNNILANLHSSVLVGTCVIATVFAMTLPEDSSHYGLLALTRRSLRHGLSLIHI